MTEHPQPIPPGATIVAELDARGWTSAELAERTSTIPGAINGISAGTWRITPAMAERLAEVFVTTAEFWLALERNYRRHLAESKAKPGS